MKTMIGMKRLNAASPVGEAKQLVSGNGGENAANKAQEVIQAEPLSWDRVLDILYDKLVDWFDAALLPNVVVALVVLILGYAAGAFFRPVGQPRV